MNTSAWKCAAHIYVCTAASSSSSDQRAALFSTGRVREIVAVRIQSVSSSGTVRLLMADSRLVSTVESSRVASIGRCELAAAAESATNEIMDQRASSLGVFARRRSRMMMVAHAVASTASSLCVSLSLSLSLSLCLSVSHAALGPQNTSTVSVTRSRLVLSPRVACARRYIALHLILTIYSDQIDNPRRQ